VLGWEFPPSTIIKVKRSVAHSFCYFRREGISNTYSIEIFGHLNEGHLILSEGGGELKQETPVKTKLIDLCPYSNI